MPITSELFAHIQNDAAIAGTFGLEGNRFINTTRYLKAYLQQLTKAHEVFPPEYTNILEEMKYLVHVEKQVESIFNRNANDDDVQSLAQKINTQLHGLEPGQKLMIPGGWQNTKSGHAMIYQFTKAEDGRILFTVINAGAGLEYHAKKSSRQKELYNPQKIWEIPPINSQKSSKEMMLFIKRLIKARLPESKSSRQRPVDAEVLYEEILPSISHVNGTEVEAGRIPEHAYTGGQLSGTCTQRSIHQMLKLHTPNEKDYQLFIFKFKIHALNDYINSSLEQEAALTSAMTQQIRIAINNNLKILKALHLPPEEQHSYFELLNTLKIRLKDTPIYKRARFAPKALPPQLSIVDNQPGTFLSPALFDDTKDMALEPVPPLIPLEMNYRNLMDYVNKMRLIKNDQTLYLYLEQLILSLPFQINPSLTSEMNSEQEWKNYEVNLDQILKSLSALRITWLKGSIIPNFDVLTLSILSLKISVHNHIDTLTNLPSFEPATNAAMNTIMGNTHHNPFWATNNPVLDARFIELRAHYQNVGARPYLPEQYYQFLNDFINTYPDLKNELKAIYNKKNAGDPDRIHKRIREHNLEAAYILASVGNELDPKFLSLSIKFNNYFNYECTLRQTLNPFFEHPLVNSPIKFKLIHDELLISSPLYAHLLHEQILSTRITQHKYPMQNSPALEALLEKTNDRSWIRRRKLPKSENAIQLNPSGSAVNRKHAHVTHSDILARDFFHLRINPKLQIPLTLDYFTQGIAKLADTNNVCYLEANLFEPGLLSEYAQTPAFLKQFDQFLDTGHRFFMSNGLHTTNSLFCVRLNYLVNRYLALGRLPEGMQRLKTQQRLLTAQLDQPNAPEVAYVLNQYLFLNLIAQLEAGEAPEPLFNMLLSTFFYLNSQTNPNLLEDSAHRTEVAKAYARFQLVARNLPEAQVRIAALSALTTGNNPLPNDIEIHGTFPSYTIRDQASDRTYKFNVHQGKLYENGLAHSGVPLHIQNEPLIKNLGLEGIKKCLMNPDEQFIQLAHNGCEIRLYSRANQLTVQKEWQIGGQKRRYELQPLSENHLARRANRLAPVIYNDLPRLLTDGSMDYWKDLVHNNMGLLVQNNLPVYSFRDGVLRPIDAAGNELADTLVPLSADLITMLGQFESPDFIIAQKNQEQEQVMLPRYGLLFERSGSSHQLFNRRTQEHIVNGPPPIHHDVAHLVLSTNNGQTRCLIPVARFYAIAPEDAEKSDFFPIVHDIDNTISEAALNEQQTKQSLLNTPLPHYQGSREFISFQLKNGEPVAETVADALYLTYIYLATDQPEKAWKTLENCTKRLGGLSGDPAELKYLSWICKDVPHILANEKNNHILTKAKKNTPPYIACQLKAMSILSDYLLQDGHFNLKKPSLEDNTANSHDALLQYNHIDQFFNTLPSSIYLSFRRLQKMRRHLDHGFTLSALERKRLLDYYHQSQPEGANPLGALGYEWMSLSLETIMQEKNALLARERSTGLLSPADQNRLTLINNRLAELKPVTTISSELELVAINLELPYLIRINKALLSTETLIHLDTWIDKFNMVPIDESKFTEAINLLSSEITEDELITHLPIYLTIMCAHHPEYQDHKKSLLDFCVHTLIANRHIPLRQQNSNIPLVANILYRLANSDIGKLPISLNDLIDSLPHYAPPIEVYQAKDVYKDILATPEELIKPDSPMRQPLLNPVQNPSSLIEKTRIANKALLEQMTPILDDFKNQEERIQEIDALGVALTENPSQESVIEQKAGEIRLDIETQKKHIAAKFLSQTDLIDDLIQSINAAEPILTTQMQKAWDGALRLANQGPDDPELAESWRIDRLSEARPTLTQAHLQDLYCRADTAYSIEHTGLSPENAQKLHELTHEALIESIQNNWLKRLQILLNQAQETQNPIIAAEIIELLSRKEIPGLSDPAIVMIQHEEELFLRDRQVSSLKALLDSPKSGKPFHEVIEKIIPGGGKSKVILPILAEKKARGDNLVVIEVPEALLSTNYVDLNRTSQRLFGKKAYRFEFNRDSNCSSKRLEQLYHLFTEIMTTRGYLITSGKSIQSLELKYLELLLNKGQKDKQWHQQVFWLDKITNLFRHNADCIIDEVHKGLSIKDKLNYTSGDSNPIQPLLIKHAIALYKFISIDFIKAAPSLPVDFDWTEFKHDLAIKLITENNSPLYEFVSHLSADQNDQLIAYLTNQAESIPAFVLEANQDFKEAFGFFKREINVILPQTLCRKMNVHYGSSQYPDLEPVEYTLAIPYAANDTPSELSRFGVNLEAVNYTIQMMLLKGISKEFLISQIKEWQAVARQEMLQNADFTHLDKTPTAQGFELITKSIGVKLSAINPNDEEQITELHGVLKDNTLLITELLEKRTLKQIHNDSAIIHSDSFNHFDLYRTTQGISGTPNPTTYHARADYNPSASLGTDGYILQVILEKNTRVASCDYHGINQLLTTLLTGADERSRCRAIIDINATFTGTNNYHIAKAIAAYAGNHHSLFTPPLKHVLYFNEENVLCALSIDKPDEVIVLASSDPNEIDRILGSRPDERFTYYDQAHTLGTDIKQAETAHALVFVDDKTSLSSFIQGVMRMRGLNQAQTIELVVPQRLSAPSLQDLIKRFETNTQNEKAMDNLVAAKLRLTNHIRRHLLSIIQDLPSSAQKQKAKLAQDFRAFFVDAPSHDLFELYGALEKQQTTSEILYHCKSRLIKLWLESLIAAGLTPADTAITQLHTEMEHIIAKSLPNCLKSYTAMDESMATEVEIQKEVEQQTAIELEVLNETFNPELKVAGRVSWSKTPKLDLLFNSKLPAMVQQKLALNTICGFGESQPGLFSKTLLASTNYANTYENQEGFLNAFLKPVFVVWYYLDNDHVLHAMIITPKDAEELNLSPLAPEFHPGSSWFATTQDTVLLGTPPIGITETPNYQHLREQIRFFNGEFDTLLKQQTPLLWLKEHSDEKLEFFETALLRYRPDSIKGFSHIKSILSKTPVEGFAYIAQRPYTDLTNFEWTEVFSNLLPTQAAEYKKLAEAFVFINNHWMTAELRINKLQEQFQLPMSSLPYLNTHLESLIETKRMLEAVIEHANKPILMHLSEQVLASLNNLLDTPLSSILETHGFKDVIAPNHVFSEEELTRWHKVLIQCHWAFNSHLKSQLRDSGFSRKLASQIAQQTQSPEILTQLCQDELPLEQVAIEEIIKKCALTPALLELIIRGRAPEIEKNATSRRDVFNILYNACSTEELLHILFSRYPSIQLHLGDVVIKTPSAMQWNQILDFTDDKKLMGTITTQNITSPEIRKKLYAHRLFTADHLMEFMGNKAISFTDDELYELMQNPKNNNSNLIAVLINKCSDKKKAYATLLQSPHTDKNVVSKIVNSGNLSLENARTLLRQERFQNDQEFLKLLISKAFNLYFQKPEEWEEFIRDELLEQIPEGEWSVNAFRYSIQGRPALPANLSFKIFKQVGAVVQGFIPISPLITEAGPEELNLLINPKISSFLDKKLIEQVIKKCTTSEQISNFLQSENSIEFYNEIHQLPTPPLATEHLKLMLLKTKDTALFLELVHHRLNEKKMGIDLCSTIISCLDSHQMSSDEKSRLVEFLIARIMAGEEIDAVNKESPLKNLLKKVDTYNDLKAILEKISPEQRKQWLAEMKNEVPKSQESLVTHLELLKVKAYAHAIKAFTDKKYDAVAKTAFELYSNLNTKIHLSPVNKDECIELIEKAKPVLNTHRGYKQLLVDIFNALLSWLALPITGNWRFFKPNTDSMNIADKVAEDLRNDEKPEP